jgi:hypothetical protein
VGKHLIEVALAVAAQAANAPSGWRVHRQGSADEVGPRSKERERRLRA